MIELVCVFCGDAVRWDDGKGWVHEDGEVFRFRPGPDGARRQDHAALACSAEDAPHHVVLLLDGRKAIYAK